MFKKILYKIFAIKAKTEAHGDYLFNLRKKRFVIRLLQISILLIFFISWELLAHYELINTFLMSRPAKIWTLFINMCQNGKMFLHIKVTLIEVFIGFLSGTILGLITAVILWWSEFLYNLFEPYLVILNSIPKVALGPVIIVWLGNDSTSIIMMALLVSIVITIIMLINGFHEVEGNKIKLLKTLGASKKQILFKVVLPASIPTIFSTIKVSTGLSLIGTIVGEFLVSQAGLGYLIVYGGQVFNLHMVMLSIIILSIIAGLMYYLIFILEKAIIKWR